MGRKIPIVSFLCGVIFRQKRPPVEDDGDDQEYFPAESPTTSGGDDQEYKPAESPTASGGGPSPKPCSPREPKLQPLPPPPGNGNFHMRTLSCGHNMQRHRRSNSSVSKLVSSMSFRGMRGGGGGGGEASSATGFGGFGSMSLKERTLKYFKHEDSIWKKTIILGERNRVPTDDDDDISLYDEKGKKITTYHPKTYSGLIQYSRQNSSLGPEE